MKYEESQHISFIIRQQWKTFWIQYIKNTVSTAALFNMVATNHMWPFKFKLDAPTWMDREIITLSEASQAEEDKYHISLTCGI